MAEFSIQGFRGRLIGPSDKDYDEARALYNGMIDKLPKLIARCTDAADVLAAVNYGRECRLIPASPGCCRRLKVAPGKICRTSLFCVPFREGRTSLSIFDDGMVVNFQNIEPLDCVCKVRGGVMDLMQNESPAPVRVVPSSQDLHSFRWFCFARQKPSCGVLDTTRTNGPRSHKFHSSLPDPIAIGVRGRSTRPGPRSTACEPDSDARRVVTDPLPVEWFRSIEAAVANDRSWPEPGLTIAKYCGHFNDRNAPRTGR